MKLIRHDPDNKNIERAEAAGVALDAFAGATGNQDEPDEDNLADLLCNLQHWADAHGVSFDDCLRKARYHFTGETGSATYHPYPAPDSDVRALVQILCSAMIDCGEPLSNHDAITLILDEEKSRGVTYSLLDLPHLLVEATNAFVDAYIQNEHDTEEEGRTDIDPLEERLARWEKFRPAERRRTELATALANPA